MNQPPNGILVAWMQRIDERLEGIEQRLIDKDRLRRGWDFYPERYPQRGLCRLCPHERYCNLADDGHLHADS